MNVVPLERMRTGYEKGNHPAIWLLISLAVFVVVARHIPSWVLVSRLDDPLITLSDLIAPLPVLFALAVVLLVPARQLLVAGASLIAAGSVLASAGSLSPLLSQDVLQVTGLVAAPLAVGGPLLLGLGLGGVRTKRGLALVVVSVAVAGFMAALLLVNQWFVLSGTWLDAFGSLGALMLVGAAVQQFSLVGWTYTFAAALRRRYRLISLGAGLLVILPLSMSAFFVLAMLAQPDGPGLELLPGFWILFALGEIVAWAALIAGVVREVGQPGT